jgi:Cu/Ag efflux pump CusA
VGGLLTGLIHGTDLVLGSLLGFLVVFGLVTRVELVLVARLQALEVETPMVERAEIVREAARERVAPVLTSAAALVAFALPFAVLGPRPGLEIVHPMALVVLGAVVSSTAVSLFVLPALYLHLAPAAKADTSDMDEELRPAATVPAQADSRVPRQRSSSPREPVS